jgi:hypothetical protein
MALIFEPPNYRVGPYQGFRTAGRIDAQEMTLVGDMEIDGTLTANLIVGATTVSGHLAADLIVDAGTDITAAVGACNLNYASSTGTFTTSSGANTLSGDVTVAAGKKFTRTTGLVTVLNKSAGYTITDTDPDTIMMYAPGTVVLPTAADNSGRTIVVFNVNASAIVVDGENAETINGAATKSCATQYATLTLFCYDGTWHILAHEGTWT